MPYRTAFLMESSEDSAFIVYLELLIDMMFFIDMCINFLTAFEDRDQRLESRIKEIAINSFKLIQNNVYVS